MSNTLKHHLHQICVQQLEEKIALLDRAIQDAQKAASEDTKSSAGDKFETSREMIKLEINKNGQQLTKALDMLRLLQRINPDTRQNAIAFGSLALTNEGSYYFSVSLGKVMLDDQPFFALSMASPVGKVLVGRTAGEVVEFRGRKIRIEEVW